jgi:hypothetical protein
MVSFLALTLVLADAPADVAKAAGCSEERPCSVTNDWKAGTDGTGQALRVYQLSRGPQESEHGECELEEYFLATGTKGRKVRQVLSLCNDGYGSAGVGEDEVKVKPNRLFHEQFGGSGNRWVVTREFQLSPPVHLTTTVATFDAAAPQYVDETAWNWDTFSGERTRFLSKCNEDGTPDLREGVKTRPVKSVAIPKIAVTRQFVEQQWKESSLGTCAGRATYLLTGAPGSEQDSSLRVLALSDTEYIVEIIDDTLTPGDQLHLWLGETFSLPWEGCLGSKLVTPAAQWIVSLPSGEGRQGQNARFGKPLTEVAQAGQSVRLKLRLPDGVWPSLMFAFADSDDGKTVERTLATSQLSGQQAATLGGLHPIERRVAICEVTAGVLTPKRAASLPAKGPLFPGATGGK